MRVNKEAFEKVATDLENDDQLPLTLEMLGEVFGKEFWIMTIYLLLDAQDAARAIEGAFARLSRGERPN